MEPHRGWTIASSSWIFLRKRWFDREQELITAIKEETKRTEEKEEARYRSPTWSILRALQKINKAKRHQGEAVMSATPFFQSVGQEDLKLWGEDDRPTVVVWESLSESEHVWCRSRKKDEEQRPFGVDGKETFSTAASKQTPQKERRRIRKVAKGNQCAGKRGGDRATSNAQ